MHSDLQWNIRISRVLYFKGGPQDTTVYKSILENAIAPGKEVGLHTMTQKTRDFGLKSNELE